MWLFWFAFTLPYSKNTPLVALQPNYTKRIVDSYLLILLTLMICAHQSLIKTI